MYVSACIQASAVVCEAHYIRYQRIVADYKLVTGETNEIFLSSGPQTVVFFFFISTEKVFRRG